MSIPVNTRCRKHYKSGACLQSNPLTAEYDMLSGAYRAAMEYYDKVNARVRKSREDKEKRTVARYMKALVENDKQLKLKEERENLERVLTTKTGFLSRMKNAAKKMLDKLF